MNAAPMIPCPHCNNWIRGDDVTCRWCQKTISLAAVTAQADAVAASEEVAPPPTLVSIQRPPATTAQIVSRVVWGIALLIMGLAAVDGFFNIELQTSAPQQAAAAGIACFHLVIPYVLARGIQAVLGAER